MKDYSGKNVVVTGGGSGIGRALAQAFAAEGANLAISDISQERLDEVAAELKKSEITVRSYRVDHSTEAENRSFAENVLKDFGHVDVVCANAGVAQAGPFEQANMENWRWEFNINFWGVVHTLRYLVPSMIERGRGGSLLITGSGASLFPSPGMTSYHANKAAVSSLGQSLHTELETYGIGVSVLCPGIIKTGIAESARPSFDDAEKSQQAARNSEKVYAEQGVEPSVVAADALKGLRCNKMIIPSPWSHVVPGWLIYRLSPRLFNWLVLRPRWRKGQVVSGVTLLADRAQKGQ